MRPIEHRAQDREIFGHEATVLAEAAKLEVALPPLPFAEVSRTRVAP